MKKGERSREKIIEESIPIFNSKGFAGTSLHQLMVATGFKKGGIYRHFESKEKLAEETFRRAYHNLITAYTNVYSASDRSDLKLIKFLEGFKKFIFDPPVPGGCPILNTAVDADSNQDNLRQLVEEAAKDWEEILRSIFEEGVEQGVFSPGIDPRKEARWIIVCIEGSIMLTKLHKDASYGILATEHLQNHIDQLKVN